VVLLAFLATMCGAGAVGQAQLTAVPEYELKAEFMGRFTLFVDWPPGTLPEPPAPFVIGVVGSSALGRYLEERVANETVKDHPVVVREELELDEIADCQMLFIAGSVRSDLDQILELTRDRPILTVADSEGFAERGVLINLFVVGRRVRFEINESAVHRSGLRIGSKLYRLARLVGPGTR
jgi:hypothetical protein